jgi:hypothetical protein
MQPRKIEHEQRREEYHEHEPKPCHLIRGYIRLNEQPCEKETYVSVYSALHNGLIAFLPLGQAYLPHIPEVTFPVGIHRRTMGLCLFKPLLKPNVRKRIRGP